MQTLKYIPRRNIDCTRCNQSLPITEFPPEYVLGNKPRPLCRKCKKQRHKALVERWDKERAIRKDLPTEKECKGCHRFKPISDFNISLNYKDGLHSNCKSCVIKKSQELKQRWKEERKHVKPPEEKLCTRCYRTFPISHFCSNISSKDGFDNICKSCLGKQQEDYSTRWIQERKKAPPKKEKTCPRCKRTLPVSKFSFHEAKKDGLNDYCIGCNKRMRKEYSEKWEQQRIKEINPPKIKECNICHLRLPLDKFYSNLRHKDGYSGTCIRCEEKRVQEYIQQWGVDGKITPIEKQCPSCEQMLPADHFVKNIRKKDGLDYVCKECSKLMREHYTLLWSKERKSQNQMEFSLFPKLEKTCSICHKTKLLTMFYTRSNSKDGYNSSCKECNLKSQKLYIEKQKKSPKVIPENKVCSACKQLLPASKFNNSKHRKDGLDIHCKECHNKKYNEYKAKPDVNKRMKEWNKTYHKKPEVREKERKRARKYSMRPDVKAKRVK